MAEQQQFYLLLGNLMSPDNNVRKHSEVRRRPAAAGGVEVSCWSWLDDDRAEAELRGVLAESWLR